MSEPVILSQKMEGFNTLPSWSRDGEYLLYASPRGPLTSQYGTRDLVIRNFATGKEEVLAPARLQLEL